MKVSKEEYKRMYKEAREMASAHKYSLDSLAKENTSLKS
jgi:hypothetical protein